jgi:hypothetical protein
MTPSKPLPVLLLILLCTQGIFAQTGTTTISSSISNTGKSEFPQWAKDLRRGEIIAFGAFPFMMFAATFSIDTYRASNHDWDSRYLPWPLKGAGAVGMTDDEHMLTLGTAIAGSLVIALADHLIVRYKRAKAERQRLALPDGELIILQKPWPPEEAETEAEDADAGEDQDAALSAESSPGSSP